MRDHGNQKLSESLFGDTVPYMQRHFIITNALKSASAVWQKETKAGTPEPQRKALPKTHPVYAAARVNFGSLANVTKGLNYPRLLKIQVASSKGCRAKLKPIRSMIPIIQKDTPDLNEPTSLASKLDTGSLYYAYSDNSDPFLNLKEIEIWEAGFRAGIRHAAKKNAASPRPDRTMTRSDQFWLTYEAWLMLITNPSEQSKVSINTFPSQIVAMLCQLGVVETLDWLQFPTRKHGTIKQVKTRTLEDNLTDWVDDFRALAQIPK